MPKSLNSQQEEKRINLVLKQNRDMEEFMSIMKKMT